MDTLYVILKYSPVWIGVGLAVWLWHGLIAAPRISDDEEEPYGEASSYRRDRKP